jgi:hypothetical protein
MSTERFGIQVMPVLYFVDLPILSGQAKDPTWTPYRGPLYLSVCQAGQAKDPTQVDSSL